MIRVYATAAVLVALAVYSAFHAGFGWCAVFIIAAAFIVGLAKFRTYVTPDELEQAFEQAQRVTEDDQPDTQPMDLRALWPSGQGIE